MTPVGANLPPPSAEPALVESECAGVNCAVEDHDYKGGVEPYMRRRQAFGQVNIMNRKGVVVVAVTHAVLAVLRP